MASQDDYEKMLQERQKQRGDERNVDQLTKVFDEYSEEPGWNPVKGNFVSPNLLGFNPAYPKDEQKFSKYLGDAVIEDALSMNKRDELERMGLQGFIEKYGLGSKAQNLVDTFSSTLERQSTNRAKKEIDTDLFGKAQKQAFSDLLGGSFYGIERPRLMDDEK